MDGLDTSKLRPGRSCRETLLFLCESVEALTRSYAESARHEADKGAARLEQLYARMTVCLDDLKLGLYAQSEAPSASDCADELSER